MNMRAELAEARPSTSSGRMVKLPGQSAGSHAAGKPGSTYGMTRQASTHPIQVANASTGVRSAAATEPYADRKF